jgi:transcriptional regulator PpsR
MQLNTLTPDVKILLDANCVVTEATVANDVSDETVSDWIGRPWSDTVSGIDPAALSRLVINSGSESVSPIFHLTQKFPSGLVAPFEYLAFRRENGAGFVAIGRDVRVVASLQSHLAAARQTMERDYWKMREFESRYRSLYEASSDPLLLVEAQSLCVTEGNPAAFSVLGLASGTRDGSDKPSLLDAIVAEDRDLAATTLARASQRGTAPRILLRVGQQADSYMLHARLLDEEEGSLLLVHLMPAAETSTQRGAEQDEAFSASQVVELSPDGIVVIDEQGYIMHANKSFLDLVEEVGLAPIIGERLDRWLGSPGGDLRMLIDSLRMCESIRLFPTVVKGSLGGRTEVEVSAVLKSRSRPEFVAMYLRDVNRRAASSVQTDMPLQFLNVIAEQSGQAPLKEVVSTSIAWVERYYIEAALAAANGNRTEAARMLGVSRQGLYDKLARYRIDETAET